MVTDRRRIQLFLWCSILLAIFATTASAKVTASIDRNRMALDETLTLTLTRDGSSFFSSPDLDPLKRDFKVLNQSQSSSTSIINGTTTSSTQWHIVLAPRRQGQLDIPSLSVGKETTNPLNITVSAATEPRASAEDVPIFIETDVDTESVYVQSQVILTLRIYWAVEARITEPADPVVPDALIKKMEDTTFNKTVGGKSYRVFERKYAIFPQKSGTLDIPPQVVEVTVPSRQRSRDFFNLLQPLGETIKLRSKEQSVTVREKPAGYPSSAVWLPATALTLKDNWNRQNTQLKVGESATLTITVTADGLLGEQLPEIELPQSDGLKLYQGKAEVDNETTSGGMRGVRKESIALIPTRPGAYELPEIRLPWWNNKLQKVEYAVLPARQLTVEGSLPSGQGTAEEKQQNVAAPDNPPVAVQEQNIPMQRPQPTFWIGLCIFLAIAWLATIYLLVQTRRRLTVPGRETGPGPGTDPARREQEAYDALMLACRKNSPTEARKAAVSWLQALRPETRIQTLSDIAGSFPDTGFLKRLEDIDRTLYDFDQGSGSWQGDNLQQEAARLRAAFKKEDIKKEGLEKLYK